MENFLIKLYLFVLWMLAIILEFVAIYFIVTAPLSILVKVICVVFLLIIASPAIIATILYR